MKKVVGVLVILLALMTPAQARMVGETGDLFRLTNMTTNEHLYTPDLEEALYLVEHGWAQDANGWFAIYNGGVPVYRVYNRSIDDHMYTTDKNEVEELLKKGWVADNDGKAMFGSAGPIDVYRVYNPITRRHILTPSADEVEALVKQGWQKEGIKLHGAVEYIFGSVNPGGIGSFLGRDCLFTDDKGHWSIGHDIDYFTPEELKAFEHPVIETDGYGRVIRQYGIN